MSEKTMTPSDAELLRDCDTGEIWWEASGQRGPVNVRGPTPLIAAMRCLVASKFGEEVLKSETT